jgi:hypothetical protein
VFDENVALGTQLRIIIEQTSRDLEYVACWFWLGNDAPASAAEHSRVRGRFVTYRQLEALYELASGDVSEPVGAYPDRGHECRTRRFAAT